MINSVGNVVAGAAVAYETHKDPPKTATKVAAVWACWTALFASYAAAVVVLTDIRVNQGVYVGAVFVALSAAMLGGAYAAISTTNFSTAVIKYLAVGVVVMQIVLYAVSVFYRKVFASNQEPMPLTLSPILFFFLWCTLQGRALPVLRIITSVQGRKLKTGSCQKGTRLQQEAYKQTQNAVRSGGPLLSTQQNKV